MARATGKSKSAAAAKAPPRRAPVFDVASLLKPISRTNPTGESLRYEGTYDAVRKARSQDDENLPRGIWETTPKRANWVEVETLCLKALKQQSKDLQIAIWLTEAGFMRHGLGGLADGLSVMSGLMETFWDDLHPHMPEDEPEFRAAPIEWLSDQMAVRLRLLPLNLATGENARPFCLSDWQRAGQAPADDEDSEESADEDDGPPRYRSRQQMMKAAIADPPERYRDLVLDAAEVAEQMQRMESLIDAHFRPADAPGLHAMRDVLEELRRLAMRVLERAKATHLLDGDNPAPPEAEVNDAAPAADASKDRLRGGGKPMAKKAKPAAPAPAQSSGGPIRSRIEAYQRLEEAAAWLMTNEPHSPTPYLIQRAVSWRDKSLVELLSELVPDDGYRGFLQSLFGAGRTASADDDYDEGEEDDDNDEWKDSDDQH